MPNRYNNDSGYNNQSDRKNYPKHIKNTDNEATRYFTVNSDNTNTAEFPAQKHSQQQRPSSEYQNNHNYAQTPGRQQYYGDLSQQQNSSSGTVRQQRSPVNQYYNQYGQRPQPERKNTGARPQQRPEASSRPQNSGRRPAPPQHRSSGGQHPNRDRNRPPQQRRHPNAPPPQQRQTRNAAPKQKKRRANPVSRIITRIIITLLLLIVILFGVYSCTAVSLIKKLNYVETGSRNHTAGALHESHVTNILLIGTDGRSVDERGRSDTMILLSVNKETKEITLTSFLRDSLVHIQGHGNDKLNHAYAYGGPELLMDTIESNFMVRIDDYVMINFNSFASIIDAVGGIEIEVSDAEAQEINTILMAEVNELMGDPVDADLLDGGGTLELNGKQALAYARIRHIGNADFERTERQRTVITKIAEKARTFKPSMVTEIAQNAVPQISTNMTTSELYWLSLKLPFIIKYDFVQLRVPADGTYFNAPADSGGDALAFDFDANYALIEDEIFGK